MPQDLIYDLETEGLDPRAHRITAIGCTLDGGVMTFCDEDESKMLREFWEWVDSKVIDRFIGFNNHEFDDYFLFWRTCKHNIKSGFPLLGYDNSIDLRPLLVKYTKRLYGNDRYSQGKLHDFGKWLDIDLSDIDCNFGGADAAEAYRKGEWDKIRSHSQEDIRLSWRIYQKIKAFI
jgi:uncharacterized protein YprB with RNaseH-like and TPR domain